MLLLVRLCLAQALPLRGCQCVGCATRGRHHSTSVASRGSPINDKVEAAAVVGGDSGSRGVGQLLLRHHPSLWSNCPPDGLGPRPLEHEAAASKHASVRACDNTVPPIINNGTAAWRALSATAGLRDRKWQVHVAPQRVGRDGCKPRACVWAVLGAQECSDIGTRGRHQGVLSKRNVECESSVPVPTMRPNARLARRRVRRQRLRTRFRIRSPIPTVVVWVKEPLRPRQLGHLALRRGSWISALAGSTRLLWGNAVAG